MAVIIQMRRDTAANWTNVNPVLNSGELGVETDSLKFKIGDGTSTWTSLPYGGGLETVNLADIGDFPTTVSATELGYLDGVTSAIQTQINNKVSSSLLGTSNGVATLDGSGKVPSGQLPSYVDDVLEYTNLGTFPATGESGKLYIALNDGSVYRWTGSTYTKISNAVSTSETATKLETPRTIAIAGDGAWSVSFDGSANVTSALTLANSGVTAGTYKSVTVDAKGRVTSGTNPTTLAGYGITDAASISHTHTAATATASGFMSDIDKAKLDGIAIGAEVNQNAFSNVAVSGQTTVVADSKTDTLTLVAGTNITITTDATTDSVTINAASSVGTADKLTTARTISLSGDATGSVSFDGSANADIVVTVADDSHNHVITNIDGLQTALDEKQPTLVSGTSIKTINNESLLGSGNISINGATNLTTTTTATTVTINSDTGTDATIPQVTTTVAGVMGADDKTKLDGIAAGANNYVHPTSGVTAGTYKSVTINDQGHVTSGTNPTTLAGYGITDAATSTHVHGDISATGTITSTAVTPADTDYILISDTSASGIIKRGIAIGTSTATFLRNDGTWSAAGTGTVTSVALSLPALFTVSGSPVTSSGTLTATLASQTANTVLIAPNGSSGAPTFRALVAADIPSLDVAKITTGTLGTARGGTGLTSFTQGGILYASSSSALASTGAGTAGQLLTSNGSGAPTWTTVSGGATLTNDTTTNATYYPTFATATSGTMTTAKVASTKLTFNPSTGTISATNFNSLSDVTLKENVTPINYGTETVLASNPVQYDWKDGSGHSFGFIAQELEQLIPEAVQDNGSGIKTVNYGMLTAVLFNTIKQLNDRISELESK